MLIRIAPVKGKLMLVVTDGDEEVFSSPVADVKEAQKLANIGRKKGWDELKKPGK